MLLPAHLGSSVPGGIPPGSRCHDSSHLLAFSYLPDESLFSLCPSGLQPGLSLWDGVSLAQLFSVRSYFQAMSIILPVLTIPCVNHWALPALQFFLHHPAILYGKSLMPGSFPPSSAIFSSKLAWDAASRWANTFLTLPHALTSS